MERCPSTGATERAAARVAELRAVLRAARSPDVQDAVQAAIADLEQRYKLGSDSASRRLRLQPFADLEIVEPWDPSYVDQTATPSSQSRWTCSERA
jgi:hypothetical protein